MEKLEMHFLENRKNYGYVNFGSVWERGQGKGEKDFLLLVDGQEEEMQSRVTAYWPDGSIKWAAHCANIKKDANQIIIERKEFMEPSRQCLKVEESRRKITVDTKQIKISFLKSGKYLIDEMLIQGERVAVEGKLVGVLEERYLQEESSVRKEISYESEIQSAEIEEQGNLKAVIKMTGVHRNEKIKRDVLPFIVRFTLYYNSDKVQILHTFLYDGEPKKDFLKGLGIQLTCPLEGAMYNRHVKILGEHEVFHEAMQLLLSWRPPIEEQLYQKQLSGEWIWLDRNRDTKAFEAIDDMTIWSNYHLMQDSANHYSIKKSTGKEDCCFITCMEGESAKGVAFVGGENGGIAIGMRHFWEKYPSSIWIDDVKEKRCKVTAWIWSPEVEAMDFRHYDDVGHAGAYYEGFPEVGATPYGIANTNELVLKGFVNHIAKDNELKEIYETIQRPPVLLASPKYYYDKKAFGTWSLPSYETQSQQWLEHQLNQAIDFYKNERKVRKWYGLFHYGDFMHTYDKYRHCWRYDMGGYAWQNTELVPTYWLWYAFLRSGREDIYTMAEAMTRHTCEVDMYHLGEFKGIGSRHNVIHWGCSCKEARIAMAGHHRFYYYLTGDYRMEDILEEVKDADFSSFHIDPLRFFYNKDTMVYPTHARSGPDWSSYVANWMTQWERKLDEHYKNKILTGIEDLKQAPLQLASGSDFEYDPKSGHLRYIGEHATGGSHLALCMGAAQIWMELADILADQEWEQMIADFGVFYFDTPKEREKKSKNSLSEREFDHGYMAASMAAFGAKYYHNSELANKVWNSLFDILWKIGNKKGFEATTRAEYISTKNLKEIEWISTNVTAQWCLNVIVALDLIKNDLKCEIGQYENEIS